MRSVVICCTGRQLEHALHPDAMGTMFSGSAVVDHDNTAGFGAGALLAFYTAAGSQVSPAKPFTQCLAYSTDSGYQWTKFVGNPVVDWIEDDNRDPKVIWHAASQQWVMALYLAEDRYALLISKNAQQWQQIQEVVLANDTECPDFFPLLDESGVERWILWSASGRYLVRVASMAGSSNPRHHCWSVKAATTATRPRLGVMPPTVDVCRSRGWRGALS